MVECDCIEAPNIYPNLNDQQQFRLNKINEIKDYFVAEIQEKELMRKKLKRYILSFDYFGKSLIVSSVTSGSISIAPFTTILGAAVRIASARLTCILNFYRNCEKIVKNNAK